MALITICISFLQLLVRPQGSAQEWISVVDIFESSKADSTSVSSEIENECDYSILVPFQEDSTSYAQARVLEVSSGIDDDIEMADTNIIPKSKVKAHVKLEIDGTSKWIDLEDCLNRKYEMVESETQEKLDNLLRMCKKVQKRNKSGVESSRMEHTRNDAEAEDSAAGPIRNQESSKAPRKQVGKVGKKRNVDKDDLSLSQQVRVSHNDIGIERIAQLGFSSFFPPPP